jgi:Cortical protein marker for cell polarity
LTLDELDLTFTADFLAVGIVILISIAIAAGVVFLLALLGILWALFSRKDEVLNKLDPNDEEEDESVHQRPSSLLAHVNAATRTTILGPTSSSSHVGEKEEAAVGASGFETHDPFGPDASNYLRAETPSDAIIGAAGEASRPGHARYSFDGTGEGELTLTAGMELEILDDRDQALVVLFSHS